MYIQTDLYGSVTAQTAVPQRRQLHYVCVLATAFMVVCKVGLLKECIA